MSLYSKLSIRAFQLASTISLDTPIVDQDVFLSVDSIITLTKDSVPLLPETTLTL